MKNTLVFAFSLLLSIALQAQMPAGGRGRGPSITGKIEGIVLDTNTGAPVEFGTVVLIETSSGKEINGTITDEKGAFKLQDVKTGIYNLSFSFLGYETKTVSGIQLTPEKPDADVGTIEMAGQGLMLSEVTVTEEAALIENKIDKMVYNAEKDVTAAGGDATDLLRKVPLLSVDLDGNVSLRGSSNIQILINGRPSTLFAENIGEALKMLPSDQIKNVEVITTPTAKYDGEGTAGIINIITKKKSIEGFSGSVGASIGQRSNRANVNLNLARGRFGIGLNAGGYFGWPQDGSFEFYREDITSAGTRVLDQTALSRNNYLGSRGSLSAYYDINAYNSINSSVSFGGGGGFNDNNTQASYSDPGLDISQIYERLSESTNLRGNYDWTTDYRKKFKNQEQELIFAFQISSSQSNQENTLDQSGNDATLSQLQSNTNDGVNTEKTFQIDYVHPWSKNVKMETGVKTVIRDIDSDYFSEVFNFETSAYETNAFRTDNFTYNQDVWAGYLSFNFKIGDNFGLVTGTRYEKTDIAGDFRDHPNPFSNGYENWLPNVILNHKIGKTSNIKLSYNKRIQRPSLYYINPYTALADPRDISYGNPNLSPELTDQYELGYNSFMKGISINASLYYKNTTDIIENFLRINDEGISVTTYQNIGRNQSIGTNLYVSGTIKKKLTLRGSVDIYTYNGQSTIEGIDLSNQAVLWNGRLNATLELPKELRVEAFGFYRSPTQTLQGSRASWSMFNIGFMKQFNKRTSLGVNISQPFKKNMEFVNELSGANFFQRSNSIRPFRSVGVNFRHSFGKLDFRQQRNRRSRINNDDLKSGSSENNQND